MKKALILIVLLVLALAFSACGRNDDETPATPSPSPTPQQPATPSPTPQQPTVPTWDPFPNGFPAEWEDWAESFERFNNHFTPVDLGGATVRIRLYNPELNENEAAREELTIRRDWVQQSFNVNLEFVREQIYAIEWGEVPTQIIASVFADDPLVHIFNDANASTWFPALAQAGVLIPDTTGWIRNAFPENWWAGMGEFDGVLYGHESQFPFAASMALAYNRELIQSVGMPMTPSEMFMAGHWNHEDFYNYLSELALLMPEGTEVMTGANLHTIRGFVFANGGYIKHHSTRIPGYLNQPFLEVVGLMSRLVQSNLLRSPVWNPEAADGSGAWQELGPAAVAQFQAGESAMTVLQRWQFYGASQHVEFGIVPYPWGSNVQWPASGDWRDLADNGYTSFMADGNLLLLIAGTPDVINHEIAASLVFSWALHNNAYIGMQAHADGDPSPVRAPNWANLFEDSDRDLWQWYSDIALIDGMTAGGQPPGFMGIINTALGTNVDPYPQLSAILGQDVWGMYELGRIRREDVSPAVWAQAELFNEQRMADED
jgi:maltose-binding protein MalE